MVSLYQHHCESIEVYQDPSCCRSSLVCEWGCRNNFCREDLHTSQSLFDGVIAGIGDGVRDRGGRPLHASWSMREPCAVQMSERVVTPRNSRHLCRTEILCDSKGNWIAASMRCVSWWRFVGTAKDGPRSVNWVSDSASHIALVQLEGASLP